MRDGAREWVSKFVNWYNNEHYHSGIKFMTPNSRHNGETEAIMNNRIKVYEAARALNPARFNKGIRDWTPPESECESKYFSLYKQKKFNLHGKYE